MSYSYIISLAAVFGAIIVGCSIAWGLSKLPTATDELFTRLMDGGDVDQ